MKLRFVSDYMNAMAHTTTMLESNSEPLVDEYYPNGLVFEQYGAPAHRSKTTLDNLFDIDVPILPWALCSPDMNVIENF